VLRFTVTKTGEVIRAVQTLGRLLRAAGGTA
jgi:hypothetical protein